MYKLSYNDMGGKQSSRKRVESATGDKLTHHKNVWSEVSKYLAEEKILKAPQNPLPRVTQSARRKFLRHHHDDDDNNRRNSQKKPQVSSRSSCARECLAGLTNLFARNSTWVG